MAEFINGTGQPVIHVRVPAANDGYTDGQAGDYIEKIKLPKCNIQGKELFYRKEILRKQSISGKIKSKIKGYRLEIVLHYEDLMKKPAMMMVQKILKYEKEGKMLMLQPYSDLKILQYQVETGDEFGFKNERGDSKSQGMEGMVLSFTTVNIIEPEFHDIDMTLTPLPGMGFNANYLKSI